MLEEVEDTLPASLPLGIRQRLSLAVAVIHRPEMLILDEPTSGVDPVARDMFWQLMVDLARQDRVTIFISTHFMNEAERCDRISLMHAGKVLASDTPQALVEQSGSATLEEAFIAWLQEAAEATQPPDAQATAVPAIEHKTESSVPRQAFSLQRLFSYSRREALELRRDPVRSTLALLGTVILMFIMGYGISMDVEDLRFAVLDRDQTVSSQDGRKISPARATSSNSHRYKAIVNWTEECATASWRWLSRSRPTLAAISPEDAGANWRLGGRRDAEPRGNRARLRAGHASGLAAGDGQPPLAPIAILH